MNCLLLMPLIVAAFVVDTAGAVLPQARFVVEWCLPSPGSVPRIR
jgi:hypothetical protein